MPGMMYARKFPVRPSISMLVYQGIRPALKYIVTTSARYQKDRRHIFCLVTRYPAQAEVRTISTVPMIVRPRVTSSASFSSPCPRIRS